MIFSFFGKKEKRTVRRSDADTATQRTGPATTASTTALNQREIARRTAEKIDEIESQMDLAIPARVSKPAAHPQSPPDLMPTVAARQLPPSVHEGGMVMFPAARPAAAPVPAAGAAEGAGSRLSLVPMGDPSTSVILGDTGAVHSVEVLSSGLLPVFEEASVLYANGQSNEAAMILWQAIKENQLGHHTEQAWKMLFELYQAAGRRPEFESLAIDYASRFESSPPAWADDLSPPAPVAAPAPAASAIQFPPRLDAQSIKQIEQMQRAAHRNRAADVDFSRVVAVDAVGADLLLRVLVDFSRNARHLTLSGVEALSAALTSSIQMGRRDPSEACWLLKLEALRFLGEQQPFEDLAIDYCVTYEVSPPSWIAPRCSYSDVPLSSESDSAAAAAASAPVLELLAKPNWGAATEPASLSMLSELAPAPPRPSLTGHIENDATALLDALAEGARPGQPLIIACDRLIRMDFSAAGSVLNWAADQQAKGRDVRFQDLHRLVAVFFNVIGISEHAWVVPRKN